MWAMKQAEQSAFICGMNCRTATPKGDAMEICLWTPKYKTGQALVDMRKVRKGKNYLFFSSDKSLPYLYSFTSDDAEECNKVYNGKILCYGIPLAMLTCEGELPERLMSVREKEDGKYKAYVKRGRAQ